TGHHLEGRHHTASPHQQVPFVSVPLVSALPFSSSSWVPSPYHPLHQLFASFLSSSHRLPRHSSSRSSGPSLHLRHHLWLHSPYPPSSHCHLYLYPSLYL